MKVTAQDLLELGVIDQVVGEPLGGAHRDKAVVIDALGDALDRALHDLAGGGRNVDLRSQRREKFLAMGKKGLA
jgi:acetyl-CoA carboxylase carboxyl transferase subunit alpha